MGEFQPHEGHLPVLKEEVIEGLRVKEAPGLFLDGTFGAGGHTLGVLEANPGNRVLALDQDLAAIERAKAFSEHFGKRFSIRHLNFSRMDELPDVGFQGMLFDFGVSSFHFDEGARGFSFRFEGPLDMRMDQSQGMTAAEFLNRASREDLIKAIRDYGEEKSWRRVVDAILEHRGSQQLETTTGLADLVKAVVKLPANRTKIHPATRTFQGIRIAINDELGVIETMLPKAFERLLPGGRLAVITFHSLEDRLVKRFFKEMAGRPVNRFDNRPQQEREVKAKLISSKPITATKAEQLDNPRSRSAKLRILERI